MLQKSSKIWMNGKFVDWDKANTHVLTHTLHYGSGVFEGIRCYNTEKGPAIFRLKEHVERMFNSAKLVNIKIPYSEDEMINAIVETVKINKLNACYIRPIAYFGYGEMGLNTKPCKVDVAIAVWPWGAYLGEKALKEGIRMMISRQKRNFGYLNKAKITGNYHHSSIAKAEALDSGYEEALMLDDRGFVAEATGENLFFIKGDNLVTPKEGSILMGITRDSIMAIAKDLGMKVVEKDVTKEELFSADEVFLTGTAAEVTPVKSINDYEFLKPNKSLELQKRYFEIVNGKNKKYEKWLTFV